MKTENLYYCYSFRLFHFLLAFNEKCLGSNINKQSKKRFWTFNKSSRLDSIIEFYNKTKHKFS